MSEVLRGFALSLAEGGFVPDSLIRAGIRSACAHRLEELDTLSAKEVSDRLDQSLIAEDADLANDQHYELPPEFFGLILGPYRKYSCCTWPEGVGDLESAEAAALKLTVERADLKDGKSVLELGCGWGSLSLEMARRFRNSKITGVSNSGPQRDFIMNQASILGLTNLQIVTADINTFEPDQKFDRIVSVEMFEHLRNYREIFSRVGGWLRPDGRLFVHVFRHKDKAYLFETEGVNNWMGRYFFSGGVMPSHNLLPDKSHPMTLIEAWQWDGTDYEKTANAWLANLDRNRDAALAILAPHYGEKRAKIWLGRWRIFFMACAELFGYEKGQVWGVSHYLFGHVDSV